VERNFPLGTIQQFSGAIVDIPDTWRLCDGTFGTPNLTDKFVVGAGDTYSPAATGGATTHEHDFTGDNHQHSLPVGTNTLAGINYSKTVGAKSAIGTTDSESSLSPYYALAYIMYAGKAK